MFGSFDPALLDDPEFKEDSVREVIIVPMLTRLGYQPSGRTRVVRSKPLVQPFIYVGTSKHPVKLPRSGGQLPYAASFLNFSLINLISNSIGLT
jgi:hypothetical protein